jgi:hypothetical protein
VIGWAIQSDRWVSVTVTSARSAPVGGQAVRVGLQIPAALWRAPVRSHLNRD